MVKVGGPLFSLEAHGWLGHDTYKTRGVVPHPYPIGFAAHINVPYFVPAFGLRPYPQFIGQYYNALGWCYQRRRTWHGIVWSAIHPPISKNKHSSKQQGQMQNLITALRAWQGFTPVERDVYNKWTNPRHASGYNRFVHWFMGLGQTMPLYWGSLDRSDTDPTKIQDAAVMVDNPHSHYPFDFTQYQLMNAVLHQGGGFPANPVEGQQFWRSDENKAYVYDGSAWKVTYPVAGGTDTRVATVIVAVDGTGDYTDIQSGINALPAAGGLVYVKNGTYELTTGLTITKSNVTLQGAGRNTIVHVNGQLWTYPLQLGDGMNPYSGIIVRDLYFDFNSAVNVPASGIVIQSDVSDVQILNNWLHDGGDANILIQSGGDNILIQGNVIEEAVGSGVSCASTQQIMIVNNQFRNNGDDWYAQLWFGGDYRPLVQGNTFVSTGLSSAAQAIMAINVTQASIIGNISKSALNFLVTMAAMGTVDQFTVLGNIDEDAFGDSIQINAVNSIVSGNIIRGCGGIGVYVFGSGISVLGNKIENVGINCVYVTGDYCNISNNMLKGTMQEAIFLYGTKNNVVLGNVFNDPQPAAANTYTAIMIQGLVGARNVYNIISHNQVRGRSVANFFKYGIGEADEYADFNDISGNHTENIQTKDIYLRGPNTQAHDNFYY
jgi:parallel beta-helix repeat protein